MRVVRRLRASLPHWNRPSSFIHPLPVDKHVTIAPASTPASTDPTLVAEVSFLSHTPKLLDVYTSFARQAAQAMTMRVSRALYLDDEAKRASYCYDRWTVNRSPFVHGKHQDQFELRTHHRVLELHDADGETVKRWMHYVAMNMPAGIGFRYRLYDREPFMLPREGALANTGSIVKEDAQAVVNKKETPQADKIE